MHKSEMEKTICVFLVAVLLTGCAGTKSGETSSDGTAAFQDYAVPEGYQLSDVTRDRCKLIRQSDELVIGGMETTSLDVQDLKQDDSEKVLLYLQDNFHGTNNVEYIVFHWGNQHPMISVNLRKHNDDGSQQEFSHLLYCWEDQVIHLWLDRDILEEDAVDQFRSSVPSD